MQDVKPRGLLAGWERDEAGAAIGHNCRNGDMASIEQLKDARLCEKSGNGVVASRAVVPTNVPSHTQKADSHPPVFFMQGGGIERDALFL